MTLIAILIGLIGLGTVVIIHELGHFIAARFFSIEVESFAVGWGKAIYQKRKGSVDYRINMFPVGGYCKLKGEESFRRALENKYATFPKEPGSLFSVHPFKRLITYAAGPFFNFVFAVLLFSLVWIIGYDLATYPNRIVLVSDFVTNQVNPADAAGLQTGDLIIELDGKEVSNFNDIQELLIGRGGKPTSITYMQGEIEHSSTITPDIEEGTGAGIIGIYSWIEPRITNVAQESPEKAAGFTPGDIILSIDGVEVPHLIIFVRHIAESSSEVFSVEVQRDGQKLSLTYLPNRNEDGSPKIQLEFPSLRITRKAGNLIDALIKGTDEMANTFSLTIQSIILMFRGVNMKESLAGPIKITYLVGEMTTAGFSAGFVAGMRTLLHLLGFISVALGFANLLPIPALDGGQMVLAAAEGITRRSISPRHYYVLQIIGFSLLLMLLFFTTFNDLRYFLF